MPTPYDVLAHAALAGTPVTADEALAVLRSGDEQVLAVVAAAGRLGQSDETAPPPLEHGVAGSVTLYVARKSSSVSPGNPTMMSVVSDTPAIASRNFSAQSKYSSRLYLLNMRLRTRVDPDCIGR